MPNTRVIGIDLAEVAPHVAAIYDPAAQTWIRRRYPFHTHPQAVQALLDTAREGAPNAHLVVVLEATGMAWWPLSLLLQQAGVQVYRLNGLQVKAFKKSLRRSGFSDRTDAQALALMYPHCTQRVVPCTPPAPDQMGLQMACRHYAALRDRCVALLNRLQAYDRTVWGGQGLKGLAPRPAWRWIRTTWYDPVHVAATPQAHLEQSWQAHVEAAGLSPRWRDTAWLPAWHARAQERQAIFAPYGDLSPLTITVAHIQTFYEHLREEQAAWRRQVVALYTELYPEDVLRSVPGVGPLSAAIYRAFVGDIHRFPNVAAFRAWTGLVPHSRSSGTYHSRGQRITKAGPDLVKETLYLNAGVARRWDVELAAIYYTQRVYRNQPHAKAQIAVATHLANRIYAVWKRGTPYELRDGHGRPLTPAEARRLIEAQYTVPEAVRQRQRRRRT